LKEIDSEYISRPRHKCRKYTKIMAVKMEFVML